MISTVLQLLGVTTLGLVGLGVWERGRHRRNLRSVPIRVHISGTRGKSSVTRLIAAGLRAGGVRAAAKTTGTVPRMILPDGREVPVFRPAGANIIEQTRVVAAAAELDAQAMVVECMALQPALHWFCEQKLIRATHAVITNARADHLDVMGPTEADVARTLAGMIPVGGVLFTTERRHLDILRAAADDRGTRLVAVGPDEVEAVSDAAMSGFCYTEHRENVAVALALLAELGVDPKTALEGMWAAEPDPGALTEHRVDFFGRRIAFVNGFAANDPESTAQVWALSKARHADVDRRVAVFNLRSDRPSRTQQLAAATFWRDADRVVLVGSGAYLFARESARAGHDPSGFVYAESGRVDELFESILSVCAHRTLVVGMANIGGLGLPLVRFFRNRAQLDESP